MNTAPRRNDNGFTLVEIAIVLVVIGLLLGGILKGQELITNAKVRTITDHQSSLRTSWFAFVSRYSALPGDFQGEFYITGSSSGNGDGVLTVHESVLAFQQLNLAGFLRCPQCTETATDAYPLASNSPVNNYGGILSVWNDSAYYAVQSTGPGSAQLMIHMGPRIPSNVLAEVDRKIDDGIPNVGEVVYNDYDPVIGGALGNAHECMRADEDGIDAGALRTLTLQFWRPGNSNPPVWNDCGTSVNI